MGYRPILLLETLQLVILQDGGSGPPPPLDPCMAHMSDFVRVFAAHTHKDEKKT